MNKDRRILLLLNALIMLVAIIILCVLFPDANIVTFLPTT